LAIPAAGLLFLGNDCDGRPGVLVQGTSSACAYLSFAATDAIVSGTGALTNLHGTLRERGTIGDAGPVGTYTGRLAIDGDDGHGQGAILPHP
jgi:hypothetical protein